MEGNLERDGYLLLRNIIPADDIKDAQNAITQTEVSYNIIDKYIQNSMLGIINKKFGWQSVHNKYRVSNNNNSSDASTFHRDIICQDIYYKNKNEWQLNPAMTILSYLDTTIMEIIPGTHIKPIIEWSEVIKTYKTRLQFTLNPGDILVFYSTTLHRGIFTENLAHRRLIQVFETYKTKDEYNKYSNDIYHVKSNETYSNIMIWLSKQDFAIYILNNIGYLNAATGYGHITNTLPYLSSEGTRGRLVLDPSQEWQPINKYVYHTPKQELPEKYMTKFNLYCYDIFFTTCFIIILLLLIIIIYLLYILCKFINNNMKYNSKQRSKQRSKHSRHT
jgi:hypothetical protein